MHENNSKRSNKVEYVTLRIIKGGNRENNIDKDKKNVSSVAYCQSDTH